MLSPEGIKVMVVGGRVRERMGLTAGREYCWQESRRCRMAGCWSRRLRGASCAPLLLVMLLNTSSSTPCVNLVVCVCADKAY